MEIKNKIIDGRQIAEKVKDEIALNVFNNKKRRPSLAIILVGERPDSEIYVSLKEREAKKVGIDTHLYRLAEDSTESELLTVIDFLNRDEAVDAILLQLPLPFSFDADKIIAAIDPLKDADGFHPLHPDYVVSPVIAAVEFIVREYKVKGQACVFHRSDVFGKALASSLEALDLKVDLIAVAENEDPRQDTNLRQRFCVISSQADLVVSALGLPEFLTEDYFKDGTLVVDVGITKENDKVFGDVDFKSAAKVAAGITPVPGGVGPMTIAFLFKNVWEIYSRR